MTWVSMPRARSQRASQNPSRPASKATAMRMIAWPVLLASARQRYSTCNSVFSFGSSFFNGWRSTPGMIPATSQLDWLISMIAMSVLSWSKATRDLLKSFGCGMGCSIGWIARRRLLQHLRRCPIASSVEKWRRRTPPRYVALSLHAVTNFRSWLGTAFLGIQSFSHDVAILRFRPTHDRGQAKDHRHSQELIERSQRLLAE